MKASQGCGAFCIVGIVKFGFDAGIMTLPNLPTDNLYKFFALSGLILIISSTVLYQTYANELRRQIDFTKLEVIRLEEEQKFLEEDITKQEIKVANLEKVKPEWQSLNIDSAITAHFKENATALEKNKNLREVYEFMFKYEDQIFPAKVKVRQILEENERIVRLHRDSKIKTALLKEKNHVQERDNKRLLLYVLYLAVGLFAGIFFMSFGFARWYHLVQKPADKKLKLELEELENKIRPRE